MVGGAEAGLRLLSRARAAARNWWTASSAENSAVTPPAIQAARRDSGTLSTVSPVTASAAHATATTVAADAPTRTRVTWLRHEATRVCSTYARRPVTNRATAPTVVTTAADTPTTSANAPPKAIPTATCAAARSSARTGYSQTSSGRVGVLSTQPGGASSAGPAVSGSRVSTWP
ncbi:hypothetical protein DEJ05_16850 [Curtobacterium sp. MCLR17_045]|nr:hypothetical protein DEJ05_16850 [Curtobacterium sp. MCLR17_045]